MRASVQPNGLGPCLVAVLLISMGGCRDPVTNGGVHGNPAAPTAGVHPVDRELWRELARLVPTEIETFGDPGPPVVYHRSKVLPVTGKAQLMYQSVMERARRATDLPGIATVVPPSLVYVRDDGSGFAAYRSFGYSADEQTEVVVLYWDRNYNYSVGRCVVPPRFLFAGTARAENGSLVLTLEPARTPVEEFYDLYSPDGSPRRTLIGLGSVGGPTIPKGD